MNGKLGKVTPLGRLLFAALWIIADKAGRLEDEPATIKNFTLPNDRVDVNGLLDQLGESGFIIRYEADGQRYIQIRNWEKYQKPHWNEKESEIPEPQQLPLIEPNRELHSPYQVGIGKGKDIGKGKEEDKDGIPFSEIISHLNHLTGKTYNPKSKFNQQWISARWREEFRLEDFYYVNQVKAEEWLGTEREKYLRPQTLYGTKMESYRQQRRVSRQYSEKTNRALVAAAKYLNQEGVSIEKLGQTKISGDAVEVAVGVPEGH